MRYIYILVSLLLSHFQPALQNGVLYVNPKCTIGSYKASSSAQEFLHSCGAGGYSKCKLFPNNSFNVQHIIDNDLNTTSSLLLNGSEQYLGVDLGRPEWIQGVKLWHISKRLSSDHLKIFVGNDPNCFKMNPICTYSEKQEDNFSRTSYSLPSPYLIPCNLKGRYVWLVVSTGSIENRFEIAEFRVFGGCSKCPPGHTTVDAGATKVSDCFLGSMDSPASCNGSQILYTNAMQKVAQLLAARPSWGVYHAEDWDRDTRTIPESYGRQLPVTTRGRLRYGKGQGSGAAASISFLNGNVSTAMFWPSGSIPNSFTICAVTRYAGSIRRKIFQGTVNLTLGHYFDAVGVSFSHSWMTHDQYAYSNGLEWLIICAKNSGETPSNVKVSSLHGDTLSVGTGLGKEGSGNLVINAGLFPEDSSDFSFSQVYIWEFGLSTLEMDAMIHSLKWYLSVGNDLRDLESVFNPSIVPGFGCDVRRYCSSDWVSVGHANGIRTPTPQSYSSRIGDLDEEICYLILPYQGIENVTVYNLFFPKSITVDMIVLGGGGGGAALGGGGGGGGVLLSNAFHISAGFHTASVGRGGAGGSLDPKQSASGESGISSSFDSAFSALGGGGGTTRSPADYANETLGKNGGSGGGGSGVSLPGLSIQGWFEGFLAFGNVGGIGVAQDSCSEEPRIAHGGGGGAGAPGDSGHCSVGGGHGGRGIDVSAYFGNQVGQSGWIGGGGGGGTENSMASLKRTSIQLSTSLGGGGAGGYIKKCTPGAFGTGGGGGGGGQNGGGCEGGTGIIVLATRISTKKQDDSGGATEMRMNSSRRSLLEWNSSVSIASTSSSNESGHNDISGQAQAPISGSCKYDRTYFWNASRTDANVTLSNPTAGALTNAIISFVVEPPLPLEANSKYLLAVKFPRTFRACPGITRLGSILNPTSNSKNPIYIQDVEDTYTLRGYNPPWLNSSLFAPSGSAFESVMYFNVSGSTPQNSSQTIQFSIQGLRNGLYTGEESLDRFL
eukprot:747640-Hanusia_phi.AAC.3